MSLELAGRSSDDGTTVRPVFDFCIIPLFKKLRDCAVFGPTSSENLPEECATNDRNVQETEGQKIPKEVLQQI